MLLFTQDRNSETILRFNCANSFFSLQLEHYANFCAVAFDMLLNVLR